MLVLSTHLTNILGAPLSKYRTRIVRHLQQGEGGDKRRTVNYAISYLIINRDKCHEEVQGALKANILESDVIWRRRESFPEEETFKLRPKLFKQKLLMDYG